MKPWLSLLRGAAGLGGIDRGGQTQKFSLYADDHLLFLSDPDTSITILLEIISNLGKISDKKIKMTRAFFPISGKARPISFEAYSFKVTPDSFTYLGVGLYVTRLYTDLFIHNFKVALKKAKQDLVQWSTLSSTQIYIHFYLEQNYS